MNNLQDFSAYGSFFSSSLLVSSYNSKNRTKEKSRLAWCYGDLSILYTLLNTSEALDLFDVREKVIQMLIETSKRKSYESTLLKDSGFCHGIAGVTLLFYLTFRKTGLQVFKDSYEYFYNLMRTTERVPDDSGFIFFRSNELGWESMVEILTGLSGVGAVTLCIENGIDDWVECVFLI